MFYGFESTGFGAMGTIVECTNAEWATDPDGCEIKNLQAADKTSATPASIVRTPAELLAAIAANNGALYVWTSNVAQSPELTIAKSSPAMFAVKAGAGAGEYTITAKKGGGDSSFSAATLNQYLPYLLLGGVGLLAVSMLKR